MPVPRILCIDNHHDGRSIFTQAYLDILRVWTANTTQSRTWLFKEVSSAGLFITSPFTHKHQKLFPPHSSHSLVTTNQARKNTSLHGFDAEKTFESSEKRSILARVGNRKIRGLKATDFVDYDFILCFDFGTAEMLEGLRRCAKDYEGLAHTSHAKVQVLEFGGGFYEKGESLKAAKSRVKDWAGKYLGFKYPAKEIREGSWRTRQVVISDAASKALARDGGKRLLGLKGESGCEFRFGEDGEGRWVVSITGRREKADAAVVKVLESW